jgi:hypothetical protein
MVDKINHDKLSSQSYTFNPKNIIKKICLIIVVDQEVQPILQSYKFQPNEALQKLFLNLCQCYSGSINNLHLDVLQVSKSEEFNHRISGYTNVSAIAALLSSVLKPDLVISFGTSGAYLGEI